MNSSFRRTYSFFVRFFARDSYSHISGVFAQISFARAVFVDFAAVERRKIHAFHIFHAQHLNSGRKGDQVFKMLLI